MLSRLIELVTGDSEVPEHRAETRDVPMLASFLGYRAYAAETQIFHLTRSKGFILELAPLMGADERIGDILTSIISDVLIAGCEFQIINYASPRIAEKLQEWALPRIRAGAVFNKLARYRLDLLRSGAWTSLASDGPFHLRQFRVLFAVGVGVGSGVDTETLLGIRDGITSALDSINVTTRIFSPTELIRFIDDVVCPATGAGDDAPDYSPFDPINEQCIRRDLVTCVEKDRLILDAPSLRPSGLVIDGAPEMADMSPHEFDVRTMSVRYFPERWAPWDTQKVIGDIFNPKLCLPCPVLQSISGIIPSAETSEAKAGWKFTRTTALADGKAARLVPTLKTQSAEWEHVQAQVRLGQKLVQIYYSVTMVSPLGRGDVNERTLKAIYKGRWLGSDRRDLSTDWRTACILSADAGRWPLARSHADAPFPHRALGQCGSARARAGRIQWRGDPAPAVHRAARSAPVLVALPEQCRQPQCRHRGQVRLGQIGAASGSDRQPCRGQRQDHRHR